MASCLFGEGRSKTASMGVSRGRGKRGRGGRRVGERGRGGTGRGRRGQGRGERGMRNKTVKAMHHCNDWRIGVFCWQQQQ